MAVRRVINHLGDPHLVRRIQERLGIKQIQNPADSESETSSQLYGKKREARNGNGSVAWFAGKTRKRVKHHDYQLNASPEPDIIVETYPVLNIFFRLASELGHEPFYITYFPFLLWNADTVLGRNTVILWCLSMYVGQAFKALFKMKRPSCPPAFRIDTNPVLDTEYGLPSTHATVATTVPFYTAYTLYHRYNVSPKCFCDNYDEPISCLCGLVFPLRSSGVSLYVSVESTLEFILCW